MSKIKPFKAVRPVPEYAAKVAALPYDVMSSAEAREMVKDKPYSFLHVDRAEIDLDESVNIYDEQVYDKAGENLRKMSTDGILMQDKTAQFYVYRLNMDGRDQTGVVACASVDEYLNGTIKKHELTRPDKEQDRINHVSACDANTGPIFLAYRGEDKINAIVDGVTSNTPLYDFVAEDGIKHTCWVVDDPAEVAALEAAFADVEALYIADGHHRNASAVKVALKKRAAKPDYSGDEEFNFYLSVIFPAEQLYIMDYNRVVKGLGGLSKTDYLNRLSEKFEISEQSGQYKPQRIHSFGMYLDGNWYELIAKNEIINSNDPVAALDVSILQENVLTPLLGIDDPRTNKNIDFVGGMRGLGELEKRVDSGEMTVAFAMYPTSMEELMSIADAGMLMPPKSTWFEPKLRSGLFIHELD